LLTKLHYQENYNEDVREEEKDELYPGFIVDMASVTLQYSKIEINNFKSEIEEIKEIKYALDSFPEEAFADIAILYAKVQSYMSRVTSILTNMYQQRVELKHILSDLNKIYKRCKTRILSTDKTISKLRNQSLQEATVNERIYYVVNLIDELNSNIEDLEEKITIVLLRDKDLERANVNIARQQRLVESLASLNYPVVSGHRKAK